MSNVDTRSILNSLFSKLDTDQKKLVNNWTRNEKSAPLVRWTSQVDHGSDEFKSFLIELDKALESGNWTFFNPEENNPSEGQAVQTTPQQADEPEEAPEETNEPTNENTDDDDDDDDDEGDAPVSIKPEEVRVEEPEQRSEPINGHKHEPVQPQPQQPSGTDPFASLVDALTERVVASLPKAEDQPQSSLTEERVAEIAAEVFAKELGSFLDRMKESKLKDIANLFIAE